MLTYFLEGEDATHRETRISLSKVSRQNSPKCEYDSMGDIFGAPTIHPRYWSNGGLNSSHNSDYRSVFSDCDSSDNLGKISCITESSLCDLFDETFDDHSASERKGMQLSGSSKHPRALNSTCGTNPFKKTACQELLTMNGKPERPNSESVDFSNCNDFVFENIPLTFKLQRNLSVPAQAEASV